MLADKAYGEDLINFCRECVKTRSYSDEEGDIARLVVAKMKELGFDQAYIDPSGNAVGRVGTGPITVNFDSHMDTVRVNDGELWDAPPFSGDIKDGFIYGRGSADMKGGLAASVFAAALAKKRGWLDGKTVWVTGTVCEEYCDGVGLAHFYRDSGVKPDFCVICEPSDNVITLGHTGKVQARVTTAGISAHAALRERTQRLDCFRDAVILFHCRIRRKQFICDIIVHRLHIRKRPVGNLYLVLFHLRLSRKAAKAADASFTFPARISS